jgi:hypothetical protein
MFGATDTRRAVDAAQVRGRHSCGSGAAEAGRQKQGGRCGRRAGRRGGRWVAATRLPDSGRAGRRNFGTANRMCPDAAKPCDAGHAPDVKVEADAGADSAEHLGSAPADARRPTRVGADSMEHLIRMRCCALAAGGRPHGCARERAARVIRTVTWARGSQGRFEPRGGGIRRGGRCGFCAAVWPWPVLGGGAVLARPVRRN